MTDLHTHILPGMDDGATDFTTALTMLQMQRQQGIDTVALTPHFYRNRERTSDFLSRRKNAWDAFRRSLEGETVPQLLLGAEVAWVPGMSEWQELEELCYENTRVLLVELPFTPWSDELFRQLYSLLGRRGVTPMIAHLDRYFGWQKRQKIDQLLDLGFPVQVSSAALMQMMQRSKAIRLLCEYDSVLISDCHNVNSRPPNMGTAMKLLNKKLGVQMADRIAFATDEALLD